MIEGIDLTQMYTTIGGVLGTPTAIFLFWMYSKVKELQTKVKILEKENSTLKSGLSDMRADVSFIRGVLEEKQKNVR